MILGGVSLACYSVLVCHMLMSPDCALTATLVALPVWFVVAFGLYGAIGR